MDINDFFNAILLVSIFVFYVLYTASTLRNYLKEDRSQINKILISINCLICLFLCFSSTLKIKADAQIDMSSFSWSGVLGSLIGMWFIGMVPAAALAVITSNIAMVLAKNHKRGDMPPGFEGAMASGLHAIFIAISYRIVLTSLGLIG